MGIYHSQKCAKVEADNFKDKVIRWLRDNGFAVPKKIKVFTCFGGDVRIYSGQKMEITNQRESFRKTEPDKNNKGEIIGWSGARGKHTTEYAEYISINRDEWSEIQRMFKLKSGDEYNFWKDYLFDKLERG